MIDYTEFAKVLGVLATLYPRFVIEDRTIAAYSAILGDLDAELLKAATLVCGSTGTFFPAAAELRAAAFELIEHQSGLPTAPEAWAEVMNEVRRVGHTGLPRWSNPLIGRAVEAIGGWWQLCTSENNVADRARFFESYNVLLERERYDQRMVPKVRELVANVALRLTASTARRAIAPRAVGLSCTEKGESHEETGRDEE